MKILRALLFCLFLTTAALADQITFSFISSPGNPRDFTASQSGGVSAGPGLNVLVSDATSGVHVPFDGIVTASTGPATSFTMTPLFILGTFAAGSADSVSIVDPMTGAPIVTGTMNANAGLLALLSGAGSFLGTFDVSFVDPTLLGMFDLSPVFGSSGSISMTFAQTNVSASGTVSGVIGGGALTVTASPVRESASALYFATGLLLIILGLRWKRITARGTVD
jgi:hypothetical protein